MRILVLLQNRYYKVRFDEAIDHDAHEVCYAGTQDYLDQIPRGLRHSELLLAGGQAFKPQLQAWLRTQPQYNRIITRQENLLMTAAELREEFHVPGMLPAQALLFRDKVKMKDAILRAGIRAPRYEKMSPTTTALPWQGKTVLKPLDGAGSRDITVFDNAASALQHVHSTAGGDANHPLYQNFEVEEFLEGSIWHVDGYMFRGDPVIVRTSKYVGTCLDYDRGQSLGSIQFDNPQLAQWAMQCLHALGADTVTFHLEAIITEEGPAFLEVAGRAGGGDIVETFERATGVHLHVLDIASDVQGKVAKQKMRSEGNKGKHYGFFIVPGHKLGGQSCQVLGGADLLRSELVEDYRVLPQGVATPKKATYQAHDVPLSGIVAGANSAELETWMRDLFAQVRVVAA